jgi:hypothetical protein
MARLWDLATGRTLGPPLSHPYVPTAVAFGPDGRSLLTGEVATGVIYKWDLHRPITGDPDRIVAWSHVLTGLDLDEHGGMRVLDREGFELYRRRLDLHGGPPEPPARIPIPADWHQLEARHCESQGLWYAARWHLDRLIADSRRDGMLCARRCRANVGLRRWADAAADASRADGVGPRDPDLWAAVMVARLSGGDVQGYRDACAEQVRRHGTTADPGLAAALAWACARIPDALGDPTPAARLAEVAVAAEPKPSPEVEVVALATHGAVLHRAGRHKEAVSRLRQALDLDRGRRENDSDLSRRGDAASDYLFLALSHHALGNVAEADRYLTIAEDQLRRFEEYEDCPSTSRDLQPHRSQEARLLLHEAKGLIRHNPPELPVEVFAW